MVLITWIVPEPDPNLRISIDHIDPSKLDYDDITWIHSSTMKQYREEFHDLEGFLDRSVQLIRGNKGKLPKKVSNSLYSSVIKGYYVEEQAPIPENIPPTKKTSCEMTSAYIRIPFLQKSKQHNQII